MSKDKNGGGTAGIDPIDLLESIIGRIDPAAAKRIDNAQNLISNWLVFKKNLATVSALHARGEKARDAGFRKVLDIVGSLFGRLKKPSKLLSPAELLMMTAEIKMMLSELASLPNRLNDEDKKKAEGCLKEMAKSLIACGTIVFEDLHQTVSDAQKD